MAWYLTDQLKYDQVLKKLVTMVLCYVKSWMTVEKLMTESINRGGTCINSDDN